jgi:hypothetical protein
MESVPNYEGIYEVSSFGQVRSIDRYTEKKSKNNGDKTPVRHLIRGRVLKQRQHTDGYWLVQLCNGRTERTTLVHQIVAAAFLGPCPKGKEVRHLDGNGSNSYYKNLEYGTHKKNLKDRERHGTIANIRGENQHLAKLNARKVIRIRRMLANGKTQRAIAAKFDIHPTTVDNIKSGKSWDWL